MKLTIPHPFFRLSPTLPKMTALDGVRRLSGGEKSFSQVCLLLALWEAMGSPIRCLDELYVQPQISGLLLINSVNSDVYMDHINRKMAIDMLVSPQSPG